jgi:predicted transcriptional regulator
MGEAISKNNVDYDSFIESAKKSLLHFQETGLHITHEEFSAWVQAIQKNPKIPIPACHI